MFFGEKGHPRKRFNLSQPKQSKLVSLVLIAFLLMSLSPLIVHGAKWKGKKEVRDGVLHVVNPAEPMESEKTVNLNELWRVGGDTDNEDEFFGLISRIMCDSGGNVYLLDTQLSEIKIFSPDGKYIRTIGREGEGPGEFRTPTGMFFTGDGNIAVMQAMPGRIVLLTPEGEPAGEIPLPKGESSGFLVLRDGRSSNNNIVLALAKNSFQEGKFSQTQYLCSLKEDGTELARYHEETLSFDFASAIMKDSEWNNFMNRWTLGTDGRVYASPKYLEYSIDVWNPDGKLERIIECPYEPLKRSKEELDLVNKIMGIYSRQVPNAKIIVDENNSDIERLFSRDDGSIWVLSSRGARNNIEGSLGTFDVFDSDGRYVRKVVLKGEGDFRTDGYYFAGDKLYVVTDLLQASLTLQAGGQSFELGEEEPKPMQVICYEMPRELDVQK